MKRISAFMLSAALLLALVLPVSAASTSYSDKTSGNKLTIPSGWKTNTVSNSVFHVKFVPSSGSALMQYGSIDLWKSLSASAQKKTPRSDIDNTQFSKADIADIIGCKASQIKLVTIGQREYFRSDFKSSSTSKGMKFSIDTTVWTYVEQGWMYLYYFAGNNSSLYNKFEDIIASATYGSTSSDDTKVYQDKQKTYNEAIGAYYSGNYSKAKELFNSISSYEDSSKYLRLIRIRSAGGNIGVGSAVYQKDCGLTQRDKDDIDAAALDFSFADTAEVLLCNPDVACYYLVGDWNGGSKCYIHFKMNNYGGTYNIGSKLSTNYQSTFSIFDGELRVDVLGSNKLTLYLWLSSPNTLEVCTYEKGNKNYTLTR